MIVAGVIVNYRVAALATEAVRSLISDFGDLDARVIVVDNDSRDGSFAALERAVERNGWGDRVSVIAAEKNGGFGYGNNLAFAAALGSPNPPDLFFLLNPDAKVQPGTTRALLDFFASHPTAGIAGTRLYAPDGAPLNACFRFPNLLGEFEAGLRLSLATRLLRRSVVPLPLPEHTIEVDWVSGSSLMIRREALERAGPFDEGFFLYCEEVDLCRRVREAGYSVHAVEGTAVEHIECASTGVVETRRRPRYWFDSRRRYFEKHHGRTYYLGATLAWLVGAGLYRARRALTGRTTQAPPHEFRDQLEYLLGVVRRPGSGDAGA